MRLPIRLESVSTSRGEYVGCGGDFRRKQESSGLFWWTIFITLLMVMTAGSWIFSLYVFAFPEKPFNYGLLTKLEKLEELKRFSATTVPAGKFHTARDLYGKFYHFSNEQLAGTNAKLQRNYLWNYEKAAPLYLKGTFQMQSVRKLRTNDVFQSGLVLRVEPLENVSPADGEPAVRKVFPALAVYTEMLGPDPRFVADKMEGSGIVFAFETARQSLLILWDPEEKTTVRLPAGVTCQDLMGRVLVGPDIRLGASPVYFMGLSGQSNRILATCVGTMPSHEGPTR